MSTPDMQGYVPGGRMHSAAIAADAVSVDAQELAVRSAERAPEPSGLSPVGVTNVGPDTGVARTTSLNASANQRILPQDPTRRRAVVMSIDNDIVICQTKELAQDSRNQVANVPYPTGFYLPKGLPGIEITSRNEWYAVNTSSSGATRVSVLVEKDENPSPF